MAEGEIKRKSFRARSIFFFSSVKDYSSLTVNNFAPVLLGAMEIKNFCRKFSVITQV